MIILKGFEKYYFQSLFTEINQNFNASLSFTNFATRFGFILLIFYFFNL